MLVGMTGFEPATPHPACATGCATSRGHFCRGGGSHLRPPAPKEGILFSHATPRKWGKYTI